MLLSDRKTALEVYNAMNDSNYDNPDELVFTTLKNAVYMGMKNDVSFIISSQLVLYEHQSSINPNMPLRDMFYTACVLSGLIMNENIYGKHQILVPEPKFVIFYNGKEKMPECSELRLSDAYEKQLDLPELELCVTVYNINYEENKELLEACKVLKEYAQYVAIVRKFAMEKPLEKAVEQTVDTCIKNGILEGESRLTKLLQLMMQGGKKDHVERALADTDYREKLYKEYHL